MKRGMSGLLVTAAVVVAIAVISPSVSSNSPELECGKPIRIEVLNGSGVTKAGLRWAQRLREAGFDVVAIRNADRSDYEDTLVVDRVGRVDFAQAVADYLGTAGVTHAPDEELFLEVTVILGRDIARAAASAL